MRVDVVKNMIPRKYPRVLLVLGWYDHRLHRGIEKYAQEHGWCLSDDLAREKVVPWGWSGDGILAWLGAGDDLADFVFQTRKPTVDFSFRRPELKFARVLEDAAGAAKLVAHHFLSRGLRNFLFYSDVENWIFNERGNEFMNTLKAAGHEAAWLRWHRSPDFRNDREAWKRKRQWLTSEIERGPKPVGIFAASDRLASEILEICEIMDVAVPEQVAIVGAGDSLLANDAMHTPISSVDTNLEAVGYRGAAELDKLMQGKLPPPGPVRIAPSRLIIRKSSDVIAVSHPGIARCLRFMWERCGDRIGVGHLAEVAGMSRRSFHDAFVNNLGRPPGEELQHVRIERAKHLLMQSDEKLDFIAEKCGYQSRNSLWVAFSNVTGISPITFRTRWKKHYNETTA